MRFNHANGHVVRFDGRAMLLHVPTTALFELDDLGRAVVDLSQAGAELDRDGLSARLAARFARADVEDFLERLEQLDILQAPGRQRPVNPNRIKVETYPLSTLVLNVNTGCNLGCTYCYKEDLAVPAKGEKMNFDIASRSVELLLTQAQSRGKVGIVFFGGEPLTNMPLIRQVVDYAERRGREEDKHVDFSLTTNATLLTADIIDYLNEHRFGISVSIDGPKIIHDRNRRTVGGRGTYDVVARKVRLLLERYRAKPVGARVTLTGGTTEVEAIHAHLRGELGFHEVGYAPVTAAEDAGHGLSTDELNAVYAAFERMGEEYRVQALRGRNTGFSNLHQLMTDLHEGRRKALPCGAGVGLLAVDKSGGLNLCHRFTGSDMPTFGSVDEGIDKVSLSAFLEKAADREGTHCETCRIRNLCAGGCYHESYTRYGDPHHRTYHYCDLLRSWVDFGVRVYTDILANNPQFFSQHIEPRRAIA
jgi:uncharacterized protein